MNWKYLYIFTINLFIINSSIANFYEYDKNVIELNQTTFKDNVFNKNYASLVEFYNSYCGDCRRYLPTWRSLASDIKSWNDIVKVSGIDCSENVETCRDYGIKHYPTIRYFSPYLNYEKNFGQESVHAETSVMKVVIINFLRNEKNVPKHWSDLTPLPHNVDPKVIFANASNELKYLVFVYPGKINQHIGYELTLDYHIESEISIKQINSNEKELKLTIIGRDYRTETIPTETHHNHMELRKILEKYFKDRGIVLQSNHTPDDIADEGTLSEEEEYILNTVKNMTHVVFQADMERALKSSLINEIYKYQEIQREVLSALRKYVAVLKNYSPLGARGDLFFTELSNFINSSGDSIDVNLYKKKVLELARASKFYDKRWVGCQGSKPNFRGYTCGLWTLFQYLTVHASTSIKSNDPLEVLEAIYGYIKYFFGCTECSQHFQGMALDEGMWNVTSKEEAIIWLWNAHNIVNDRLSGDWTDDPVFPKIKFPSKDMCPQCRQYKNFGLDKFYRPTRGFEFTWVKDRVLAFLRVMHSNERISEFGTTSVVEELIIPRKVARLTEKNVFH